MNITTIDFHEGLKQITSQFRGALYNEVKATLLFELCQHLTQEEFKNVINYLILNSRSAPGGKEFEAAIKVVKDESRRNYSNSSFPQEINDKSPRREIYKCSECKGDGIATRIIPSGSVPYEYYFRCYCPIGVRRSEAWPILEKGRIYKDV